MMLWIKDLEENFYRERERWIAWIPVLFGTGIGIYFVLPFEPSGWIVLAVFELILIAIYFARHHAGYLLFLTALLVIVLGFADILLQAQYRQRKVEKISEQEVTYLKGRIIEIDRSYRGKARISLNHAADFDKPRLGKFRITLPSKNTDLKEGQCVELIATLMPDFLPALPGTYQFGRKAFFENYSAFGYANSKVYVIDCPYEPGLKEKFSEMVSRLRRAIVEKINQELPPDQAGIAAAVIAGDRNGISREITENYRQSGLAHFLAISGLHMSMVAGMAFFALRLLLALIAPFSRRYNSKKAAALLAIFMSFAYLLISGAQISTQRAFIMMFVVLLGILFDRRAISMRMVSLAAIVVLIISPQALISAGFQMSFAAVVVLIAFYERFASKINRIFSGKHIWQLIPAYIVGLLLSDLVASLATLPFAIYHFNQIAVYTTIGNLLAGPFIGFLIMPFVLLSLVLMPIGLSAFSLKIVGFGVMSVNAITAWVAGFPGAGFKLMSMPLWGLLCMVIGGLWLCLWKMKWRLWGWILIGLGCLSLFMVQKPDVIYDQKGKTIALKDQNDYMVIMPGRVNGWIRQIWLEKTVSPTLSNTLKQKLEDIYQGNLEDRSWLALKCDDNHCIYKDRFVWDKNGQLSVDGKSLDPFVDGGGMIFLKSENAKIKTICGDVGARIWNSCGKF